MNESRRNFLAAGIGVPALLAKPQHPAANNPAQALSSPPKLAYRTLGRTGLKVTSVAFGSMITSDGTVLERAADLGVNYFDTARGYQNGNCERMVGNALKSRRKQLYISTKSHARTREAALADLDKSLAELQTDYVDIWYLHAIGKPDELSDELIEAQAVAKKAGKIRFAGFSTHTGHNEVIPAGIAKAKFDVVLSSFNFAMDPGVSALLKSVSDAGTGVVAMKVMAGGQRRGSSAGDAKTKEILKRDGAMLAALKWVLKNPFVHTTIPSITDMEQLDENLRAMAAPFTPADGRVLEARLREIGPEYCRMCNACAGQCRHGLPVADLNRYLMYSENYGQFSLGRENFRILPAALRQVRCSFCDGCTVECPHGVLVSARLARAQECFA
jgi:aryl-alcohol dehydrogenase-like predicted oxidoreductase